MQEVKVDWAEHVAAFRAGSQSLAEYCAAAGLKASSFYYHVHKKKSKRQLTKRFK